MARPTDSPAWHAAGGAPQRRFAWLRARIVLLAAAGMANRVIAERLGTCENTAHKWRRRYREQGIAGLANAPRPGKPQVFPAGVVAEVKALACELPAASGITPAVSPSTVRRWPADDALKPLAAPVVDLPRDPRSALKASRALDLCQQEWEGRPLGGNVLFCGDAGAQKRWLRSLKTGLGWMPVLRDRPRGRPTDAWQADVGSR